MLISDFLSLTFQSNEALTGVPTDSGSLSAEIRGRGRVEPFSPDPGMADLLQTSAAKAGIDLVAGTYCWLKGPSYETAAEIRMLGRCGVDAVGMSTVPEIAEARRLGMAVAGVSLISNLATGLSSGKLSHGEVTATAGQVQEVFTAMMKETLVRIGSLLAGETAGRASDK